MDDESPRLYLDANATCPPLPEAIRAAAEAMTACYANPSSPHAEGRAARAAVTASRIAVATLLGAHEDEVVFTSGGTEANVLALAGLAMQRERPRPVLISATEHPCILAVGEQLSRRGHALAVVPVEGSGVVALGELERLLARHPGAVVAVQLANHETGVMQPVRGIADVVAGMGGVLHCDAVQAVGRVGVDFGGSGAATLALAGHKFGAPHGAGALVVRRGVELEPVIPGTQENHRRGGTENVGAVVGLGVAARHALGHLGDWAALGAVRDRLEAVVQERLPGARLLGAQSERLPNTSCIVLPPPLRGATTVAALDLAGIAVSSGPACSSGVERRSGVVEAMGWEAESAERVLRVSLAPGTDTRDVERLVGELEKVAARVRRASR